MKKKCLFISWGIAAVVFVGMWIASIASGDFDITYLYLIPFVSVLYGGIPAGIGYLAPKLKQIYSSIVSKLYIVPVMGFIIGTCTFLGLSIALVTFTGWFFAIRDTVKFIQKKPLD